METRFENAWFAKMSFTVRIIPFQTATLVSYSFQSIDSFSTNYFRWSEAGVASGSSSNYLLVARDMYGGVQISRDQHFLWKVASIWRTSKQQRVFPNVGTWMVVSSTMRRRVLEKGVNCVTEPKKRLQDDVSMPVPGLRPSAPLGCILTRR